MDEYDLLVIGAGSGGVRAARMAASTGANVAIVEEKELGGTCVNVGCVPKKLFYYASHLAEDFEEATNFGWRTTRPAFDWHTLRDNKNSEIARLNQVYGDLLNGSGVTLIRGRACLTNAHEVLVDGQYYRGRHILIATGAWPYIPQFPGREHVISSNEIFHLSDLPRRAIIVGGGYIAVEFAGHFQWSWRRH